MNKKLKYALGGVIAITFIVGIPLVINESYKVGKGYITLWDASDVLSYYGNLLGAIVTAGVFAGTIIFTHKQIQKQDYENREKEKWKQIDTVITSALEQIHPLQIAKITAKGTQVEAGQVLAELAEYGMNAKGALDMVNCYVTEDDYKRIEPLIDNIVKVIDKCCRISNEYSELYNWIIQGKSRDISVELLKKQEQIHNEISNEKIEEYRKNINTIPEFNLDVFNKKLQIISEELISVHAINYRSILTQKRKVFDVIYGEIACSGMKILKF